MFDKRNLMTMIGAVRSRVSSGGLTGAAVVFALALPVAQGLARVQDGGAVERIVIAPVTLAPAAYSPMISMERTMNMSVRPAHSERLRELSEHAFAPIPRANPLPRRKPRTLRQTRTNALKSAATSIAIRERVPPELFTALVHAESSFNPGARSHVGAIGLTQLMPATAKELGVNPHDPMQNLVGGARYLRRQYERFGTWKLALAAYNAGPTRVARVGGVPNIRETRNYVTKIITLASL